MDNQEIAAFFRDTQVNIEGNRALREPQRDAYRKTREHFAESTTAGYVQLPVGCGKTGLMGVTPFGISRGRVLIVVPNLTIRDNVMRELDISNPNCFYRKRGVFEPQDGPFLAELRRGANVHDSDAAHIVVANIQQFAREGSRWYEQFNRDYFQMILVDEGHHNVAASWSRLFEYFGDALVISYTATPMRSDGQQVFGQRLYAYSYARSMMMRFIAPIDAVFVKPERISFTIEGENRVVGIDEVLEMREKNWFSRGVALSEASNRHIANAAISKLNEVREHGRPRQIIAVACSIRHAEQVAGIFRESGLRTDVLHSRLPKETRDDIEARLRSGATDAVVQIQILGEGYDLSTLSVAAVFRPYRSLPPYIQFVGRVLRLATPDIPDSPGNRTFLVSHVGMNDERWWEDFRQFDQDDQSFFQEFLVGEHDEEVEGDGEERTRLSLRPFMRILDETVRTYIQRGFLREVDEQLIGEVFEAIRSKGFEPSEFGLDEDVVRARLEMAAQAEIEVQATPLLVQPQRRREALRQRLPQEARSIAHTVASRLDLNLGGGDLIRHFPGRGTSNSSILVTLAAKMQNEKMGIQSKMRSEASLEQVEEAVAASADLADALTAFVRSKLAGTGD